jgi:hypothetical protein
MLRPREHVGNVSFLDDAPRVHHADAVRESSDDGKIVRDPDQRGAGLAGELLHLEQNLSLDRHIERCRRLVGDDQIGSLSSAIAIATRWRMPPEN